MCSSSPVIYHCAGGTCSLLIDAKREEGTMDIIHKNSFTKDFHMLTALICHLSATEWRNRTPSEIAGSLAMDRDEVERVLIDYPGFFRESINKKKDTKERLFTAHLRYALRRRDPDTGARLSDPLDPDHMSIMLNLLKEMISVESEERRLEKDIRFRKFHIIITAIVSVLAALIGLLAGIISAS